MASLSAIIVPVFYAVDLVGSKFFGSVFDGLLTSSLATNVHKISSVCFGVLGGAMGSGMVCYKQSEFGFTDPLGMLHVIEGTAHHTLGNQSSEP